MTPCPEDVDAARAWHIFVKGDAMSGSPVSLHGQALLSSARHWPAVDAFVGECACGSTLMFARKD